MIRMPRYRERIEDIIYECVKIKRDVVEADERDTGLRMILNFGHTIGHAAEKLGNYTVLTHGQAVSIGMVAAMKLSHAMGESNDLDDVLASILMDLGLPTELPYAREDIFHALLSDKKKMGATVNFILVRTLGRADIEKIDVETLHQLIQKI
jgi:3-dehydroquinate synthase